MRKILTASTEPQKICVHTQILLSSIMGIANKKENRYEPASRISMKACFIGQLLRQILSPKDVRGMAGLEDNQPGQLTQMGYSSMSAPMLTFIANFKFQKMMIRLFMSFSQGFLPASPVHFSCFQADSDHKCCS